MPRYALRLAAVVAPVVSGLGAIPIFNECSISVDISTMAERLSRIRQSKQHKLTPYTHLVTASMQPIFTQLAVAALTGKQPQHSQSDRWFRVLVHRQTMHADTPTLCMRKRMKRAKHAASHVQRFWDSAFEACCFPCLSSKCTMPGKGTFGIVGACREIGCHLLVS